MKIFKFGGASVSSIEAVKNMVEIIQSHQSDRLVIVVSAMGKTTNQLERIFDLKFNQKEYHTELGLLEEYHLDIIKGGPDNNRDRFDDLFNQLKGCLAENHTSYDAGYDQIIPYGELLSTTIIHGYLKALMPEIKWVDARSIIKTDDTHRDAKVDWSLTNSLISKELQPTLSDHHVITQGFIASNNAGQSTTLGREGSDFTGSILAHCLDAASLTVWKDVPGILNADPKLISEAEKFDELSYEEASELTYYGAKVIHPKTIKPLANKNIPLFVRPFQHPSQPGTLISHNHIQKPTPSIIFKDDQTLISFVVEDFTFINEHNLTEILHTLTNLNIKINLMQNSAISFSICIDYNQTKIEALLSKLSDKFSIRYNDGLQLITVKNSNQQTSEEISKGKDILLEQKTRHNFQIVVRTPKG